MKQSLRVAEVNVTNSELPEIIESAVKRMDEIRQRSISASGEYGEKPFDSKEYGHLTYRLAGYLSSMVSKEELAGVSDIFENKQIFVRYDPQFNIFPMLWGPENDELVDRLSRIKKKVKLEGIACREYNSLQPQFDSFLDQLKDLKEKEKYQQEISIVNDTLSSLSQKLARARSTDVDYHILQAIVYLSNESPSAYRGGIPFSELTLDEQTSLAEETFECKIPDEVRPKMIKDNRHGLIITKGGGKKPEHHIDCFFNPFFTVEQNLVQRTGGVDWKSTEEKEKFEIACNEYFKRNWDPFLKYKVKDSILIEKMMPRPSVFILGKPKKNKSTTFELKGIYSSNYNYLREQFFRLFRIEVNPSEIWREREFKEVFAKEEKIRTQQIEKLGKDLEKCVREGKDFGSLTLPLNPLNSLNLREKELRDNYFNELIKTVEAYMVQAVNQTCRFAQALGYASIEACFPVEYQNLFKRANFNAVGLKRKNVSGRNRIIYHRSLTDPHLYAVDLDGLQPPELEENGLPNLNKLAEYRRSSSLAELTNYIQFVYKDISPTLTSLLSGDKIIRIDKKPTENFNNSILLMNLMCDDSR